MRPDDDMGEAIKKNLNFAAGAKMHDRILADVLEAEEESKGSKSALVWPSIWRIIMKSPLIKLAMAAAIIIVAAAGIYLLSDSSAGVAIGQVKAAMEKINWAHTAVDGTGCEMWLAFESKIIIEKQEDGSIHYMDFGQKKDFQYDASSETITVMDIPSQIYDMAPEGPFKLLESPLGFLDDLRKVIEADGGQVTQSAGEYEGIKVVIWEFSHKDTGFDSIAINGKVKEVAPEDYGVEVIRVFIDAERHLPLATETKFIKDGKVIYETHTKLEYPEVGPKDVYELGAPRTAKIVKRTP